MTFLCIAAIVAVFVVPRVLVTGAGAVLLTTFIVGIVAFAALGAFSAERAERA